MRGLGSEGKLGERKEGEKGKREKMRAEEWEVGGVRGNEGIGSRVVRENYGRGSWRSEGKLVETKYGN